MLAAERSSRRLHLSETTRTAVVRGLVLIAIYFAIDRVLNTVVLGQGWQIFWPLGGCTVALLVMHEKRDWPLILFATSIGEGLGELFETPAGGVVILCVMSILEMAMSAALLPRVRSFSARVILPGCLSRRALRRCASGRILMCY